MLDDVKDFSRSSQTGLFINSCFAHCQSERQETWFADDSPLIDDKVCSILNSSTDDFNALDVIINS